MASAESKIEELEKPANSNFQECVSKKISIIANEHPEQKHEQNIAIAHEMCRKSFGVSKAELVFLLEKNESLDSEILLTILEPLMKAMNRQELIEYATLRKLEGAGNQELAKQLPRSPSWFKKYVNPKVSEATQLFSGSLSTVPGDTFGGIPPEHAGKHIHDLFTFEIADLQKAERIFEGWGSVEVKDSQKDKLPTDALEKIMPTYMKRGAVIMFGHSNRHVGNILKFEFKTKEVDGKQIPALWLKGQIFNDYKIDDEAWEAIKLAQKTGKPVLSLGATPIGPPTYECDETECFRKFDDLQLFEFTVTDLKQGQQGANPEATIEMALAKQADQSDAISENAWIGGKMLKMKQEGTLPDDNLELVDLMLDQCGSCQDDFSNLIKAGKTELEAKEAIFTDLVKAMSSMEQEVKDIASPEAESPPAADAAVTKDNELSLVLNEILKGQKAILAALSKEEPPMPEEEKPEEEEEPMEETKAKEGEAKAKEDEAAKEQDPVLTLAKAGLTEAQFLELSKTMGFQKIDGAPAPSIAAHRELTKGSDEAKKPISLERNLEAMRKRDLSLLDQ